MKKLFLFIQTLFLSLFSFSGIIKNQNSAFNSLTSGYSDYSDYTGVVRKVTQFDDAVIEQFSYSLTNTTGKNLNVALTRPSMINVQRTVVPDASGKVLANGGGVIAVAGTAPITLYDDVAKIANIKTVDAVIGDGIVEAVTGSQVLYANTVSPASARLLISADNLPISYFLNQLNDDDLIVESININVNDASIINTASMVIKDANSFNSQSEKVIKLRDFINEKSLQDKVITINTVDRYGYLLQLDKKSLISLYMPGLVNGVANTFMTIQFNVKRIIDDSKVAMDLAVNEYLSMVKNGKPTLAMQQFLNQAVK